MSISMIHKAKDLSPDEKAAIERLVGRIIAEDEEISIRVIPIPKAPSWLRGSWKSAKQQGVDKLSVEQTDPEIAAARKARH